jgi:hypothetical protein
VFFPFVIALSKVDPFFFCCHAVTLSHLSVIDKPLGDLSSYLQRLAIVSSFERMGGLALYFPSPFGYTPFGSLPYFIL